MDGRKELRCEFGTPGSQTHHVSCSTQLDRWTDAWISGPEATATPASHGSALCSHRTRSSQRTGANLRPHTAQGYNDMPVSAENSSTGARDLHTPGNNPRDQPCFASPSWSRDKPHNAGLASTRVPSPTESASRSSATTTATACTVLWLQQLFFWPHAAAPSVPFDVHFAGVTNTEKNGTKLRASKSASSWGSYDKSCAGKQMQQSYGKGTSQNGHGSVTKAFFSAQA